MDEMTFTCTAKDIYGYEPVIPQGYKAVRLGLAKQGEYVLPLEKGQTPFAAATTWTPAQGYPLRLILEKLPPRRQATLRYDGYRIAQTGDLIGSNANAFTNLSRWCFNKPTESEWHCYIIMEEKDV